MLVGSVPIREATEVLLTIERMKAETKREATAAINRLAGALEAIAEQIGGLKKLQSPPPAKVCTYFTIFFVLFLYIFADLDLNPLFHAKIIFNSTNIK